MLKNSLDKPRTVAIIRPDQTRPDQTRPDQTRPDQTSVKSGHFCCVKFHHAPRGRTASVECSAEVVRSFCVRRKAYREVRPHA